MRLKPPQHRLFSRAQGGRALRRRLRSSCAPVLQERSAMDLVPANAFLLWGALAEVESR